jgi:hypothetical protein
LDNWREMVDLNLLNLSVVLPKCANSVSASYDSAFGVTLVPADYYTSTSGLPNAESTSCSLLASSSPASARCGAAAGAHCGSASLWGGPRSSLLPSIEAAERAFQLPSPHTVNGTWLKTSAAASTGYFLLSGVDLTNWEQMIALAKGSGMKMVVLLNAQANSGHFQIGDQWHGMAGLAGAIQRAHAQGIKVGLHTMSASIPVQDAYITPTPDPRLAALPGWILQDSINASTTTILLNKVVSPGWGLGKTMRIGDELVTFSSSEAAGNMSTLGGVVRGAFNTTAVAHWREERVSHLREMFGFLPDPATDLIEEMGSNLAKLVDTVDADYVYFDGIEGLSIWGGITMSRFHRAFWEPLQRKDLIVQSSGNFGELWHLNTRSGQRDWGATDTRAFFSYFGAGDVAAASQDLQVPDVGWWPFGVFVAGSFYATTPDEVEFMSAQAAAWDGVQNLETDFGWLAANGRSVDALQRSSNWHDVILPASMKERIRTSKMVDFQLFSNASSGSGWYIRTMYYHPPVVCDTASCNWSLEPALTKSSVVGVRARVLTALAEDGSGQNLMLYGYGLNSHSSLGLPSTLNTSITFPNGSCLLAFNYSSPVATAEAMGLFTQVFKSPLDLSGHTAIGLTIRGDGSNAIVVVRLEDSEGECRNFIVEKINWTGWKTLTVNVPQARRLFDFPLIRLSTAMRYYRWSAITSMTIAVTNALSANIAISRIVARKEVPAVLSSASVQAGDKHFPLPDGLQAQPCTAAACEWTGLGCFPTPKVGSCAEYVECSESGCKSFDANNHNVTRALSQPRAGATAEVTPDSDTGFVVQYQSTSQGVRARVQITVIEESAQILGPFSSKNALKMDDTESTTSPSQLAGVSGGVQWGGWPWHGRMATRHLGLGDPPGPFLCPTDWVANLTKRFNPSLIVLDIIPPMACGEAVNYPKVTSQTHEDLVDLLIACKKAGLRVLFMVSLNCATSEATYNKSWHNEPSLAKRGKPWWPTCGANFAEQAGEFMQNLAGGTEALAIKRGGVTLVDMIVAWAPQGNNDLGASETRIDVNAYVPDLTSLASALYNTPARSTRTGTLLSFGLPIIGPDGKPWSSPGPMGCGSVAKFYRNLQSVHAHVPQKQRPRYLPTTYDSHCTDIQALASSAAAMSIDASDVMLTDFKLLRWPCPAAGCWAAGANASLVAKAHRDVATLKTNVFWLWTLPGVPDSFYSDFIKRAAENHAYARQKRLKTQALKTDELRFARARIFSRPSRPPANDVYRVTSFGAVPDGVHDATPAFQAALDAAAVAGGGVVLAPAGRYRLNGGLEVHPYCSLEGTLAPVVSHDSDLAVPRQPQNGTVLMAYAGRDDPAARPLLTIGSNGALRSVTVFYPDQRVEGPLLRFPFTVQISGRNAAVEDVECLNSYNCVNATHADRFYIARLQGQPINIGVYGDMPGDICRMEDVHFTPYWFAPHGGGKAINSPAWRHQLLHGRAFVFGPGLMIGLAPTLWG